MKKDTIGLFLDTSQPKTVLSYAQQVNDKFNTKEDTIVELAQRFVQAIVEKDPSTQQPGVWAGEELALRPVSADVRLWWGRSLDA